MTSHKTPIERRIREQLKTHGMSVTDLAKALDVSRVALYYLFKGNFSREMLNRISRVLGIPAHVLIAPDAEGSETQAQKLMDAYRQAPIPTQKAVDVLLNLGPVQREGKPVVIVLDDIEDNAELLKRSLRKDYEVYDFTDPFSALEAVRDKPVMAVISDQRMPQMTGTEFFKKVDEMGKSVAKLIVSAYSDNQAFMQAINETKIDAFILKPQCMSNSKPNRHYNGRGPKQGAEGATIGPHGTTIGPSRVQTQRLQVTPIMRKIL